MPKIMNREMLEIPCLASGMSKICHEVFDDRIKYPDIDFHKRKGIIKEVIEEYWPLTQLVRHTGVEATGCLTGHSNNGPDAIICNSGQKLVIQITCANQSYNEALNREMLSRGSHVFQDQEKLRDRQTNKILSKGRALTTRAGKLLSQVKEIEKAIVKKINNYHKGTDVLLIDTSIHLSDSNTSYSWKNDLDDRINALNTMPYHFIYIVYRDGVHLAYKKA